MVPWFKQVSTVYSTELIDDFERGNLNPYTVVQHPGEWSITTSAIEGTYAATSDYNTAHIQSYDGDGLNYYPEPGDIFQFRANLQGNNMIRFGFGVQDPDNRYIVTVDAAKAVIQLDEQVSGSTTTLANQNCDASALKIGWLDKVEIQWDTTGDITIVVVDDVGTEQANFSANSTQWTDGGIGWMYLSGGQTADPISVDELIKTGAV